MAKRQTWMGAAFFLVTSCLLVGLLLDDALPFPFYATYEQNQNHPVHPVAADSPVAIRFALGERTPDRIVVPVELDSGSASLEITLLDPASGRRLAAATATATGAVDLQVPDLAGARELQLQFSSSALNPDRAPRLYWSQTRSRQPYAVTVSGVALAELPGVPRTGPLFRLAYPQPSRALLLGWPLALVVLVWGLRRPGREVWPVVALALAATLTSVLLWQKAYDGHASNYDPDQYGHSAVRLAGILTDPDSRADARDWYRGYPHSHTSLAPALMSLPIALGASWDFVYLEFSAVCGFLTLLVFFHALSVQMKLPHPLALLATLAFACHPELLAAFAKPITDVFGLLLVVAMLAGLAGFTQRSTLRQRVALAALLFALPLARPQGWSYWVFVALVLAACARLRAGRIELRGIAGEQLAVFALPLLALAALYRHFDWFHNVELMLAKAKLFQGNTWQLFALSLAMTVQGLPLLWVPLRRGLGSPVAGLWLGWLGFYLAVLVVARAPFFPRHFIPALPVVYALSALGLARLGARARLAGLALLGGLAGWNALATLRLVFEESEIPFFFW